MANNYVWSSFKDDFFPIESDMDHAMLTVLSLQLHIYQTECARQVTTGL